MKNSPKKFSASLPPDISTGSGSFFSQLLQEHPLTSKLGDWLQSSVDQGGSWIDKISDFLFSRTVRIGHFALLDFDYFKT